MAGTVLVYLFTTTMHAVIVIYTNAFYIILYNAMGNDFTAYAYIIIIIAMVIIFSTSVKSHLITTFQIITYIQYLLIYIYTLHPMIPIVDLFRIEFYYNYKMRIK